jgi:hypothetical protein
MNALLLLIKVKTQYNSKNVKKIEEKFKTLNDPDEG